ncbi:MAG: glycosyltransferase [Actinomycetota bacterium]|nr:glycosyltransferase [Actinomycetota bacterium]
MNILLVHNRYRSTSPGGEDRVVDQEAAALSADGHTVERFERRNDEIADWRIARKAVLPAQVLWSDATRRSLARTLQVFRPDVVHVHNTFPLMSPSVLYACRTQRIPVVATFHHYRLVCASGTLFRDGSVCHDCVGTLPVSAVRHGCYGGGPAATLPVAAAVVVHGRAWRRLVSAYIFLSQAQRDVLAGAGLPPDRLFVKPNFVPRPTTAEAEPDDIVVYAGRLTEAKGLPLLMSAWEQYLKSVPEPRLRLVLAGGGPLQNEVTAWARVHPSVVWLGMLTRAECAELMARARAAVVPSQWQETFGLIAVEAMAAGVPPIAAAHGSFPELISDGVDGVLFPAGDASALGGIFQDLEQDRERFRALGRAARVTFERRFTEERNVSQLLDIYRFAIDHPACPNGSRR